MALAADPTKRLFANQLRNGTVAVKLQPVAVVDPRRNDLWRHVVDAGGEHVAGHRAWGAHRRRLNCFHNMLQRQQRVPRCGRLLQRRQGERAHPAQVCSRVQARRLVQRVQQPNRVVGEHPAVHRQQPHALRVLPGDLVKPIGVAQDLLVRGNPRLLPTRTGVVQIACLLDAHLEPAQELQVGTPLRRQSHPRRCQFLHVVAQRLRQVRSRFLEDVIDYRPRIGVVASLLLNCVRNKNPASQPERRQHRPQARIGSTHLPQARQLGVQPLALPHGGDAKLGLYAPQRGVE